MEENLTEKDMEQWFRQYLNETFGENFGALIVPPEGVRYGERLIYKYKSGATATRHETTKHDLENLNECLTKIAQKYGATYVPGEPPVSSGLPWPRFVDLKENDIFWENGMKKYYESEDLLPSKDFDLEWAVGLLFASDKTFFHLDFTHPKVKGIFHFQYDSDYDRLEYVALRNRFTEFTIMLEMYKRISDDITPFKWVKLTQLDSKITITTN